MTGGPADGAEQVPQFGLEAFSLAGRTAIVSGGSDGIGRMIAHGFADAGASVVVSARGEEKIVRVVAEIRAKGHEAIGVRADATDPGDARALATAAIERFGQIDVLMNVVGGSQGPTFNRGPLLEITKRDFNEAFNVNVRARSSARKRSSPRCLSGGRASSSIWRASARATTACRRRG